MKKSFQPKYTCQIVLTMVFGAVVSASHSPPVSPQSAVNLSFGREDSRLHRPIVIPNLTGFSEDFFKTKSRFDSKDDEKLPEAVRATVSDTTDRDRDSSQDSVVKVPLQTKESSKFERNVSKFSARYSSKPEVDGAVLQDAKEGIHQRSGTKKEQNEGMEVSEVPSLLERAEDESDILPDNTVYPGNTETVPFLGLEKDRQDQTSDTDEHTDTKETEREPETVPTSSEPKPELRISSSVDPWVSRYSDDEEDQENREDVQQDDIAVREQEDEERRRADDAKNYHSIQTPLHKIKFIPPHEIKDESEYGRMRTRPTNPPERDRVRYDWPYFKSQVKAEAEKENEIPSDGDENRDQDKDDSVEWESDKTGAGSKVSDLDRAAEKDEARFGPASHSNEKYNLIREKNRHLENQKALIAEEEKDHERPLFKMLSHNSENGSELSFGDKTTGKTNKEVIERWTPRSPQKESSEKLDSKPNNLDPTNFNITKELEPEFQGLNFLSSAIFNKKSIQQQQRKNSQRPKEVSKNIFIQELENKEMIDQKNLSEGKTKELVGGSELTSESFNHLEESDDMYNQILANIQSVFGLRTQPLKSSVGGKGSKDAELKQEEDKSLTWSTTMLRRGKGDREGSGNHGN